MFFIRCIRRSTLYSQIAQQALIGVIIFLPCRSHLNQRRTGNNCDQGKENKAIIGNVIFAESAATFSSIASNCICLISLDKSISTAYIDEPNFVLCNNAEHIILTSSLTTSPESCSSAALMPLTSALKTVRISNEDRSLLNHFHLMRNISKRSFDCHT
ncbi:Uncharacterised protein [Citrobacter amalonaticus]|nr:Uncharacterised protein [Citrobacter amalonaticus]